jgi:3-oxoacyl-[acyl-carrier-protein] synthase-3
MAQACESALANNGLTIDQVAWLVPHQANQRILDQVGKKIGIAPEKVFSNVKRYGNLSATSIPLAMYELREQLNQGDNILLTAFGAGLTWGAGLMKW